MPAGLHNHDSRTGHQPRVERRSIPVPHRVPAALAVGFLAVLERIIDQRNVGTAPRNGRPDASSDISPAVVGVHSVRGLAIRGQADTLEHFAKLGTINDVADVAAKVGCQFAVIAGRDDLPLGIAS